MAGDVKMYEGPILPGQKWLFHGWDHSMRVVARVDAVRVFWTDGMNTDVSSARAGDHCKPVDIAEQPAPPAERQLAPGWKAVSSSGWMCTAGHNGVPAVYEGPSYRGACLDCAELAGVFATVEPAKESAPVCRNWCGRFGLHEDICVMESCYRDPASRDEEGRLRHFCSTACKTAGRPLNPTVKFIGPRPTFERADTGGIKVIAGQCPKCPHRHVGPCGGSSPNGEYGCPCGHVAAKENGTRVVGSYGSTEKNDRYLVSVYTGKSPQTKRLLANLAAEKPPVRELKVKRRYMPGANLDE